MSNLLLLGVALCLNNIFWLVGAYRKISLIRHIGFLIPNILLLAEINFPFTQLLLLFSLTIVLWMAKKRSKSSELAFIFRSYYLSLITTLMFATFANVLSSYFYPYQESLIVEKLKSLKAFPTNLYSYNSLLTPLTNLSYVTFCIGIMATVILFIGRYNYSSNYTKPLPRITKEPELYGALSVPRIGLLYRQFLNLSLPTLLLSFALLAETGINIGIALLLTLSFLVATFFYNDNIDKRRRGIAKYIITIFLIFTAIFNAFVWIASRFPLGRGAGGGTAIFIDSYKLTISPTNSEYTEFSATEVAEMRYPEKRLIEPTPKTIVSTSRGFMLREVAIRPLEIDSTGTFTVTLQNGRIVSSTLEVSNTEIQLIDFPKGSFHEARDAKDVTRFAYVDQETIIWSAFNSKRGVVFAYIPPHYRHLKPLINPFLGLTTVSNWIIAICSIIVTFVLTFFMTNLFPDIIKSRLQQQENKSTKETNEHIPIYGPSGKIIKNIKTKKGKQ